MLQFEPPATQLYKPTPALLKAQQPYFAPLVEAFGYRNLRVEGMEADDVIGTLVTMAEAGRATTSAWSRPTATPSSSPPTRSAS